MTKRLEWRYRVEMGHPKSVDEQNRGRLPELAENERAHGPATRGGLILRLAEFSFLTFILALAWMKAPIEIGGLSAFPMDFLFVLTAILWLAALAAGETSLRWNRGFWLLGIYFAAMTASAVASDDPQRSAFKLATQAYLLALPVLAFNLARTGWQIRRLFIWWLAGSAAVALLGVLTLILFPLLGPKSVLDWPLHHFGTLPPGPYPRLELTFVYPSLLANYLGVSLMLLLIGDRLGWFSRTISIPLGTAILASAFFALTPGFGGLVFMLGAWLWYVARDRSPRLARVALVVGCAMPALAVIVAAISPTIYETAPYLIDLRPFELTVAPSVRLLAWTEAMQNFLAHPLLGHGIGLDAVSVAYEVRNCSEGCVTDAHNMYLNIAAQCGLVGLAALLGIIAFVVRQLRGAPAGSQADGMVFGLCIAWIAGFAMQGLVGSFEDARHLWVLLGVLMSAQAIGTSREEPPQTAGDHPRA